MICNESQKQQQQKSEQFCKRSSYCYENFGVISSTSILFANFWVTWNLENENSNSNLYHYIFVSLKLRNEPILKSYVSLRVTYNSENENSDQIESMTEFAIALI